MRRRNLLRRLKGWVIDARAVAEEVGCTLVGPVSSHVQMMPWRGREGNLAQCLYCPIARRMDERSAT